MIIQPETIPTYLEDPECAAALLKFSQEALAFADDLANLQSVSLLRFQVDQITHPRPETVHDK
jgi:hypothetical protein